MWARFRRQHSTHAQSQINFDLDLDMSEFQSLIYVSSAAKGIGVRDMIDILEKSTELNRVDRVNGMLLLCEGEFMQCIEGEVGGVERTYARIQASKKHHRIVELFRSPVTELQFSGWDWAFQGGFHIEFSTPETAQFLTVKLQELADTATQITPTQKILRRFWDTTARSYRILKV